MNEHTHNEKLGPKSETFGRLATMALLVGLAGCASAADPSAMTVATTEPAARAFPQPLMHAMCVRNVTGGEATNPMWVSKVDNEGFRTALSGTLQAAGLAASSSSCSFPIDVNLLGLSQPAIGLDMTVTSHANYKVYDTSGQPLLLATVDAPYTAKMSDAFIAAQRLKLANEGSIRESMKQFLDKLRDTTPK